MIRCIKPVASHFSVAASGDRLSVLGGNRPSPAATPASRSTANPTSPSFNISSTSYRVLQVDNTTQTLRVSRDLWGLFVQRYSSTQLLNFSLFDYSSAANDQNITLYYGCGQRSGAATNVPQPFNCNEPIKQLEFLPGNGRIRAGNGFTCNSSIYVPVNRAAARDLASPANASTILLQEAIRSGFSIQWSANNNNCNVARDRGCCGLMRAAAFACYCADRVHELTCDDSRPGNAIKTTMFKEICIN
ncbi:UNVERIFIED_CONTAM: hypothetical protein Sangu_1223800 [Sesamum angustifolium]|uniref:Wall-associated receptor kinase C-terminal domain-containing protein n=1 Tax=Sesamum angustifolium TaxID=2727405 RepID=A0AAW2NIE6_9LAMI